MKEFILKLVHDYNTYSELVALSYENKKEGHYSESTMFWNTGILSQIEDYLKYFESNKKIKLYWEYGEHNFGFDDILCKLKYKTVDVVFD